MSVSLTIGSATLQFDEQLTASAQLKSAVPRAGYGADGGSAAHGHKANCGCCG